ncbi:unnamed protein product [Ceutorhynchus assimilis]|uniref:Uncharacterized protein n=1 Tax=Ceutorhynchus assimilis TaxID=467358 RepID=A0A9N9MU05_9CUCU|nr:unnamed protein product [Ceutorhynchus assimilis]
MTSNLVKDSYSILIQKNIIHHQKEWLKALEVCPEEIDFIEKNVNVPYCIAGGFSSFLCGYTNTFDDIDVFVCTNAPDSKLRKILTTKGIEDDYDRANFSIYDYTLLSRKIQFIFIGKPWVTNKVAYLNHMCAIIFRFDLAICMTAILPNGCTLDFSHLKFNDVGIKPERVVKYSKRPIKITKVQSLQEQIVILQLTQFMRENGLRKLQQQFGEFYGFLTPTLAAKIWRYKYNYC